MTLNIKNGLSFVVVLVFFLLPVCVSSVTLSSDDAVYRVGVATNLSLYSFNSSGMAFTNTTGTCEMTFFDSSGGIQQQEDMSWNGENWFSEVNESLMTLGHHSVLFYCEQNGRGGYLNKDIVVTNDGVDETGIELFPLGIIIILPLLFGFALIVGVGLFDPEEHFMLRLFSFLIAIVMFFVSLGLGLMAAVKYYDWPNMTSMLGSLSSALMWGVGVLIILYWLIYFIFSTFKKFQQDKEY